MAHGARIDTIIGEQAHMRGDFRFSGAVRIDGYLCGQVEEAEHLVVGPSGRIHATVCAHELEIAGEVHGRVLVSGQVRILTSGKLCGDIRCGQLVVQEGGIFVGKSQIGATVEGVQLKGAV